MTLENKITARKLTGNIGAEISGIDLTRRAIPSRRRLKFEAPDPLLVLRR